MITIREARTTDADTIVLFQLEMARETEEIDLDRPTLERGVRAVFDDPSKGQYLVAEDDGAVVASLLLTFEWSDWRAGTVLWIQSVWVEQQSRGRGVYRALYESVKSRAADDSQIRGVRLYVDQRNDRAQQVYTRLGMDGEHYRVFEWMK